VLSALADTTGWLARPWLLQDPREQEPLQWRLGWIVDAAHFSSLVLFGHELHRGLKTIDIQPQRSVQFAKLSRRLLPSKAVKANKLANNVSILGKERIFVVTGPNQGGKTTFARTFGRPGQNLPDS
jgi:hypothetical protein